MRKIDIIWNTTMICPWNCSICCVDAVHVTKKGNSTQIRSDSLNRLDKIPFVPGSGSIYDQAVRFRQEQGKELDLAGKLRVVDHLAGFRAKIDFSGGDPLSISETLTVMCETSARFGRENVTLTATGAGLGRYEPEEIAPLIGELNFTYDNPTKGGNNYRPGGYADGNLQKAAAFARTGVRVRAECPLTTENIDDETLQTIYLNLHEMGIEKLLLMRLFPVGRGEFRASSVPTPGQYRRAIALLRNMERQYGYPKVKVQCALKFFDNQKLNENPCDLVRESFGLMTDGTLLASPWAVDNRGRPLGDAWVLGNLSTTSMAEIMASEKVQEYERRLDENWGQCKIHAYLQSRREQAMDRIFDLTDSLYALERTGD